MRFVSYELSPTDQQRWRWQVLSLLLGFGLLAGLVYFYYEDKVDRLEQQQRQLIQAQPAT